MSLCSTSILGHFYTLNNIFYFKHRIVEHCFFLILVSEDLNECFQDSE